MSEILEAVILANGRFPYHQKPLSILDESERIICCDGAANDLIDSGRKPAVIIGDMDSISQENYQRYKDICIVIKDDSNNDLTKAALYCNDNGYEKIVIVGGTGKREDHTIGNIALLSRYTKMFKEIKMVTNTGEFIPVYSGKPVDTFIGQQISIFSINPYLEIKSEKLKYPLSNLKLEAWWMGTLNEAQSESFVLYFESKEPVIVFKVF